MEKVRSYGKEAAVSVFQEKLVAAEGRKTGTCRAREHWFEQKKVKNKKASVPNSTRQKSRKVDFCISYLYTSHRCDVLVMSLMYFSSTMLVPS